MEHFDQEMERRVWQRVRGETEPARPPQPLQALAAAERSAAAAYLMLSRMMQGREKELLRQLHQRERIHGRYLNGISLLTAGQRLAVRTQPPETERAEILLRRCYAGCLRAAAEYGRRAEDGEYGHIFARMAREEQENCAMILEILGGMEH